jgi:hypothetical protein
MVAHAFNPSTWEAETGRISEFEASLVYKVSSRTARATQRNPVSKNKQKKIVLNCLESSGRVMAGMAAHTGSQSLTRKQGGPLLC